MPDSETSNLEEELKHFQAEKEKIRKIVGQIGGVEASRRDRVLNVVFIVAIVVLFVLDVLRHIFEVSVPLPQAFSIELAVLLVSVKIIWMIHRETRVAHFQFWILNSIEFRLNDLSRRIQQMANQRETAADDDRQSS